VHQATLNEVIAQFGHGSEQREAQARSRQWLVPLCHAAGIVSLLINGSFVTAKQDPNDVDCVALAGDRDDDDSLEAARVAEGLPFIELRVVDAPDYVRYREVLFGSDRDMIPKGAIEVRI
jgi:hypothetical protein